MMATPFGLYQYKCLAMGLKVSTNIAQEIMEDVLCGILDCEVFINDVALFSNSWEEHQRTVNKALK